MWTTTLDNLMARKLRVLATSLAVLIGVAFMAGTMVLTDTMGRSFDELFEDLYAGTDAVVRSEPTFENTDPFGGAARARVDDALVREVAAIDGVAHAFGDMQGFAQIVGRDGEPIGNPGMGAPTFGIAWPDLDVLNPLELAEGRAPANGDEAVIDVGSAEAGGLGVGDTATVLTAQGPAAITIVGLARWTDADSPLGASITAFVPAYAQTLISEPGKVRQVLVVAEGGISQREIRDRVAAQVPYGIEVVTGAQITAEDQSLARQALGFFGSFMLTFALVALFVGSFIIHNTFSILVAQRNREMALLRAIGASRRQVLGSLLIEAVVVGLIASILGLVAGVGVAFLLKELLAVVGLDVPAAGVVVSTRTILAAFLAGVVVTVAAAVLPARRASRIPPVAAMSDVAFTAIDRRRLRVVAGLAITVAAAVVLVVGLRRGEAATLPIVGVGAAALFLGVASLGPVVVGPVTRALAVPLPRARGMVGTLARENSLRSPKRTASTAAALMIGVGLVGFITIVAASAKASLEDTIDRSFRGDFVVDSGTFGFGGFGPDLAPRLAALPEVAAATPARIAQVEIEESALYILGVDASSVDDILDVGVVDGSLADLDVGSIAVWEDRADDAGWEVGDTIEVRFAETGPQSLRVGAIYANRELVGAAFAVDVAVFDANVGLPLDVAIYLAAAPGFAPEEVRAAVEALTDDHPNASVLDLTEYKDLQAATFDQLLGLVFVLLALAILIALLGIANTLALSVLERTRELGLLRAVGMSRRQVRSMVRWEAVVIAVFGSLLGTGISLFFGWAVVEALEDEGITRLVVPVGQLALVLVVATLAGVVAAIVPARRAARLDVLAAVSAR